MIERVDIEEKIKKLLALSESDNPHEASAALLKAQELMLKYNTIEADNLNSKESVIVFRTGVRGDQYNHMLAEVISENFRTKTYNSRHKMAFVGFEADVKASEICLEFLAEKLKNGWIRYMSDVHSPDDHMDIPLKNRRHSYKMGFVAGVREDFEARKIDKRFEIMVSTPREVQEVYDSLELYSRTLGNDNNEWDMNGYRAGYEYGQEMLDSRSIEEN